MTLKVANIIVALETACTLCGSRESILFIFITSLAEGGVDFKRRQANCSSHFSAEENSVYKEIPM